MKKTLLVPLLCVAGGAASAADVGLGVSIRSSDPAIYVPIEINNVLRIEPFLEYSYGTHDVDPDPNFTMTTSLSSATAWTLGSGVFGVAAVSDSFSAYYGARLGYMYNRTKTRTTVSTGFPTGYVTSEIESKQDGFLFAPTVGLEYRFTDRFSIAGEAGLQYSDLSGDGVELTTTGTKTNVVARYRF